MNGKAGGEAARPLRAYPKIFFGLRPAVKGVCFVAFLDRISENTLCQTRRAAAPSRSASASG